MFPNPEPRPTEGMGYELQVFRGDDPEDERTFAPLDGDLAHDLLLRAERAGDVGAEIVVPRESLTATVALSRGREGELRSLWVSVDAHDADSTEREREFRGVLELLVETASRLDASLYDRQQGRVLEPDDLDGVVASFANPSA
jgi:hypothetical protein